LLKIYRGISKNSRGFISLYSLRVGEDRKNKSVKVDCNLGEGGWSWGTLKLQIEELLAVNKGTWVILSCRVWVRSVLWGAQFKLARVITFLRLNSVRVCVRGGFVLTPPRLFFSSKPPFFITCLPFAVLFNYVAP
jgi:hypothetical protein